MIEFTEAWEAYQRSTQFKAGNNPKTVKTLYDQRKFIENLLYWAFREGWDAARDANKQKGDTA